MDNIVTPSETFDFSQITLDNPAPLHGGSFFTKLKFGGKGLPLYVQYPKCLSKNGIVKNSTSKRGYLDLQFNYFEKDVFTWMENLENRCRELIYEKRELWFQTEMLEDDIESMFISPMKPYRSGKFLIIRTNLPSSKNIKQQGCLIYDENERPLEYDSLKENVQFIPLAHIEGIKFSSKSFQIEINIRQVMILSLEDSIKKNCLIKNTNTVVNNDNNPDDTDNNKSNDSVKVNEVEDVEDNKKLDELQQTTELGIEDSDQLENPENITLETLDKNLENSLDEKTDNLEKQVVEPKLDDDNLHEFNLDVETIDNDQNISLKNPSEVYYEIYKTAYDKAKRIKQAAVEAHLEAQKIKLKYNLDEMLNSDDELSNFSDFDN